MLTVVEFYSYGFTYFLLSIIIMPDTAINKKRKARIADPGLSFKLIYLPRFNPILRIKIFWIIPYNHRNYKKYLTYPIFIFRFRCLSNSLP